MGRRDRRNREKRKKSDGSESEDYTAKAGRYTKSPKTVCVSTILSQTNSVLYEDSDSPVILSDICDDTSDTGCAEDSDELLHLTGLFGDESPTQSAKMSSASVSSPSNADLLAVLEKLQQHISRVEMKMEKVDKKMEKLDSLESKLSSFEKEMSKIWVYMKDTQRKTDERMEKVEDRVENVDFNMAAANERVDRLEKERRELKEEVVYLQSQSMRNNLVFTNIDEAPEGTMEDCEKKVRGFLVDKMNLAEDLVRDISFDRVHRMGQRRMRGCRNIVARFTQYKDKETVRKEGRSLRGTIHHVFEQYPKEVIDRRRRLLPKMREARGQGKRAWLSYDTLFIDGRPVRDSAQSESESR